MHDTCLCARFFAFSVSYSLHISCAKPSIPSSVPQLVYKFSKADSLRVAALKVGAMRPLILICVYHPRKEKKAECRGYDL